jgi:hypothetical protein
MVRQRVQGRRPSLQAELPKSALYLECLPLFMRQAILLPDHPQLLRELRLRLAESGLARGFSRLLRQQIQCLAEKFPTQRNREFFEP